MSSGLAFVLAARARRGLVLLGALGLAPAGCIDTELDPTTVVECSTPMDALKNVVFIKAGLGRAGSVRCSGVLVTRTLVVTALGCVMVPNELADTFDLPGPPAGAALGTVYHPRAADPADCSSGTATEDGSFSTLFGQPLPADAFDVYLASERFNAEGHKVNQVLRVDGTRCSTGLALLQLGSGIGPLPIPVRSSETESLDEPLLLSYFPLGDTFELVRQDLPMQPGASSPDSSPRSFELADTCPRQSGAPLFSANTGALVGILASSLGSDDCKTPGPGTAVRLSAFRRLLIDAAAPEKLQVESGAPGSGVAACSTP